MYSRTRIKKIIDEVNTLKGDTILSQSKEIDLLKTQLKEAQDKIIELEAKLSATDIKVSLIEDSIKVSEEIVK